MNKKAFFLLFFVALLMPSTWACGPAMPNYDAYVFRLFPTPQSYARGNDMRLAQAWSQLIGTKVTVADSRQLARVNIEELDTLSNPIARYARNNKEVGNYLRLLVRYLNAADIFSAPWDYPSPEQIANYQKQLRSINSQAEKYQGQQLKERYFLLRLRILFRQQNYGDIIALWEKSPLTSGSVFADMARDLYAGALYHQDRVEDAAVQYAISGNMFDAHLCMRNMHGSACMSRIIQNNPNSPVLPYMLEEIVNGCAESIRYYEALSLIHPLVLSGECIPWQKLHEIRVPYSCYEWENCPEGQAHLNRAPSLAEWFEDVRPYQVNENESMMLQLIIDRQLDDKQVTDQCMWLSAKAYLQYLKKNYQEAWTTIEKAVKASGSGYSKLNAAYLRLLIATGQSDLKTMEQVLVAGLPQLPDIYNAAEYDFNNGMSKDGSYQYWDFGPQPASQDDCLNHLVGRGIVGRYLREGDSVMASLAWSLLCGLYTDESNPYAFHLPSVGNEHYTTFCQLSHDKQMRLLEMVQNPKKVKNALAKYILSRLPFSEADYLDVVGTNYLRDGRFAEAIPYLEKVPIAYLNSQPIAPYAYYRSIRDIPWEKKDIPWSQLYDEDGMPVGRVNLTSNAKVEYCREVLSLQREMKHAQGQQLYVAAYNLGALYHQASVQGSCWWLAYYGISTIAENNQWQVKGHFDFVKESRKLLHQALGTNDISLRFKAYYLELFQGQSDLLRYEWDSDSYTYYAKLDKESVYYPTLVQFKKDLFGRPETPDYVSHCDVLSMMCKNVK